MVVGAGFTGLEIATELAGRLGAAAAETGSEGQAKVVLIEQANVVGPDLGPGPRPIIEAALAELGVEVRLAQTLESITPEGVRFTDGTELPARTVVWTAGMQASPLTLDVPGRRDPLGRLYVDRHLRIPETPDVLAAGDTAAAVAEPGRLVMQSCQHATPLGKYAGHNAVADLLGLPSALFEPAPYVTCLDLGPARAVFTTGWERTVQITGAEAKQRKRTINRQWIYPPLDDAEAILRRADYQVKTREAA
ncbi:MAG: FAD-dependent oxidoreductase [Candidatus Dormibacteraceae bacterium]